VIEPVELLHRLDHKFVKHPGRGCATCGRGKHDMAHVGTPQSIRMFGSGANHFTYQTIKHAWQAMLAEQLNASGLPTGLGHVLVEGEACFPTRTRRDQGNHRFIVEKALGDALTDGAWLEDDDWTRYEFGGLAYRYVKGESWTRLVVFPTSIELALEAV
jgi:hypothetical protein